MRRRFHSSLQAGLLLIAFFSSRFLHAQDAEYDSLLLVYLKLDSVWLAEIENDSLNIFNLLDSLDSYEPLSQLAVRSSYNSQVYNAGRSYGIDQYSFGSGISYYHKSGVYADVSGQYYSGISPHFNATALTIGYSGFLSKFGYSLGLSHTVYHELEENSTFNNTLNNSIAVGAFYYTKSVTFGLDYNYSFGSESTDAHRLVPSLTITPKIKAKGFLKHFKSNPSVYMTFGSEALYTEQYNNLVVRNLIRKFGRERFLRAYNNGNEELLNLIYDVEEANHFGPLNFQISIPIQFTYKKVTSSISYNINLPIALPDEVLDKKVTGYFGVSVHYFLSL